MIEVVFDTTKTGLETIMKPWKAETLRYIWSKGGDAATTTDLWEHIYPLYGISRTSIGKFLKRMTEAGVLKNRPQSWRGVRQGTFSTRLSEEDFKVEVIRTVLNKLLGLSPKTMRQFMEEIHEQSTR